MKKILFLLVTLFVACSPKQNALTSCRDLLMDEDSFKATCEGKEVGLYTLHSGDIVMQCTNYGARVISIMTPDRDGKYADVVLGYSDIDSYINNGHERFLGASVGPVANRIAEGKFTLEGVEYQIPQNSNGQALHGGIYGIDRVVWDVVCVTDDTIDLKVNLPDGFDGFPGNRTIGLQYKLTPDNTMVVTFRGTTDKTTIMNMSHHSFFNLKGEGEGNILDNVLQINASAITPIDRNLIPTGEIMSVEGTPFDFREAHTIGQLINADSEQLDCGAGYDHNWIIDRENDGQIVKFVDLYEPVTGRGLEVWSDDIALQFYCGNFFDGTYGGKSGKIYEYRGAVAFEPQHYPDSINHENFPTVVVTPDKEYSQTEIFKFYTK